MLGLKQIQDNVPENNLFCLGSMEKSKKKKKYIEDSGKLALCHVTKQAHNIEYTMNQPQFNIMTLNPG